MVSQRLLSLAAIAALVLVAASGCGGSAPGGSTSTAAAARRAPVAILTPLYGTDVRARHQGKRAVDVHVQVAGNAQPGSTLRVDAGNCSAQCERVAVAGADGSWSTSLAMELPAQAATADLSARYLQGTPGDRAARVRINIRPSAQALARMREQAASTTKEAEGPAPTTKPKVTSDGSGVLTYPEGSGAPGAMILIGDSLSVGQEGLLTSALRGWTVQVSAEIGRHLGEGMSILAAAHLPGDGAVIAMGLFTNDDPWRLSELAAAVGTSLRRAGPSGCAIWATIASPPVEGQTFDRANRLLNQLGRRYDRLRIVPWAQVMAAHPELLGGDGVHPTPAGERVRAQLYARAAKSCV